MRGSRVSDYLYDLPDERIARYPADRRDSSRLMVLGPGEVGPEHRRFREIVDCLEPGDLLVVNESKVLPARLLGRKPTGAAAEVLLLRPVEGDRRWEAWVRPGSKLKPGRRVEIADDLAVRIVDSTPEGGRIVELETPRTVEEALGRYGHMPLPPYIDRPDEPLDRERYQTVYARTPGSVAAPTAGLHFTSDLLEELARKGVERTAVTLHVGPGTFRPVETDDPDEHAMHSEWWEVPERTVEVVERTRARGGRVVAVGTTVVRTLESAAAPDGALRPGSGDTELFIRPGYEFRVVEGLVTNFHLPRSTLLMLVAAFAGYGRTMEAYETAIREGYRFYSYGDAMLLLR